MWLVCGYGSRAVPVGRFVSCRLRGEDHALGRDWPVVGGRDRAGRQVDRAQGVGRPGGGVRAGGWGAVGVAWRYRGVHGPRLERARHGDDRVGAGVRHVQRAAGRGRHGAVVDRVIDLHYLQVLATGTGEDQLLVALGVQHEVPRELRRARRHDHVRVRVRERKGDGLAGVRAVYRGGCRVDREERSDRGGLGRGVQRDHVHRRRVLWRRAGGAGRGRGDQDLPVVHRDAVGAAFVRERRLGVGVVRDGPAGFHVQAGIRVLIDAREDPSGGGVGAHPVDLALDVPLLNDGTGGRELDKRAVQVAGTGYLSLRADVVLEPDVEVAAKGHDVVRLDKVLGLHGARAVRLEAVLQRLAQDDLLNGKRLG